LASHEAIRCLFHFVHNYKADDYNMATRLFICDQGGSRTDKGRMKNGVDGKGREREQCFLFVITFYHLPDGFMHPNNGLLWWMLWRCDFSNLSEL
jgi:hypothetical protein